MDSGGYGLLALTLVCAFAAVVVVVTLFAWRRRWTLARVLLAVLLMATTIVSVRAAAAALTRNPAASASQANRDAPVASGGTVYTVTYTKTTSDTVVALDARAGTIRWSKVFAGDVVTIRARGPKDVIVEMSVIGRVGGAVMALRASDGSTLWQYTLGADELLGSGRGDVAAILPLDASGAAPSPLYVMSQLPAPGALAYPTRITALRAADGVVMWQDTAPASAPRRYERPTFSPTVILFESSLYLQDGVAGHMEIVAVDALTGQTRWNTTIQQGPNATLRDFIMDSRAAYVATYDTQNQRQEIEALRLSDGKTLWRVSSDLASGIVGMTGSGGVMIAARAAMVALDSASGKTLWSLGADASLGPGAALEGEQIAPVALAHTVYFVARFGSSTSLYLPVVYAVDAATGSPRWTYHLDKSTPTTNTTLLTSAAGGQGALLYIVSGQVGVTALDAATGAMRWQAPRPGDPQVEELSLLDVSAAPATLFLSLATVGPPRPGRICEGGVSYPSAWALSGTDGSVYWRTPIAPQHAFGSAACS